MNLSYAELAQDGAKCRVGIALWAGKQVSSQDGNGSAVRVTHVLLLRGTGVRRARGYISISPELLNDVTDTLAAIGENIYLLGQIHGHPPGAGTDLSDVDIAYGIRSPKYLSVVAPGFGMFCRASIEDCGVHVFNAPGGWRRLTPDEVAARLVVPDLTTADVTCLTLGDNHP